MSKSLPPPSIEWLQALLDHIPDRIYFKDRKSRFVGVSRALAEFFGLDDPADAIGKTDFDFFTPEHARPAFEDEQRIVQTGEGVIGKIERETLADGRSGWASTTKMPLIDIDGRVIGTFGISRDITELRETEQALAAERRLLRSVIDQLPEFIYVKDPAGRYVLSNLAHARFLGVESPEAILGRTAHDFFPDEIANRYHADDLAVLASGETLREHEEVTRRPDTGAYGWVSMSKAVLRDSDKQTVGLVCVARDITERKLGEEQLRQAMADVTQSKEELQKAHHDLQQSHRQLHETQKQLIESEKLRSVGRLAAGVAFDGRQHGSQRGGGDVGVDADAPPRLAVAPGALDVCRRRRVGAAPDGVLRVVDHVEGDAERLAQAGHERLHRTVTGAGARLLGERLSAPLARLRPIVERLQEVAALVDDPAGRDGIRRLLRQTPDLARALSRLALGRDRDA